MQNGTSLKPAPKFQHKLFFSVSQLILFIIFIMKMFALRALMFFNDKKKKQTG